MYQRARYYDPTTGEFIAQDPLEYVDGYSLYRGYFGIAGVDPFGLDWLDNICNFSAGVGDTISFGATRWIRSGWNNDVTDTDSGCYSAGEWTGVAADCVGGGVIVKGIGKQVCKRLGGKTAREAAERAAREAAERVAREAAERAVKGLRKQLEAHKKKLADYINNPDAFDNKGFLKNADKALRQKIITSRIKSLQCQIDNFQRQINRILNLPN